MRYPDVAIPDVTAAATLTVDDLRGTTPTATR
jgi:hypothetical protein